MANMVYEEHFEKVFAIKLYSDRVWEVPNVQQCGKFSHLEDKTVIELKHALNNLKGSLNDFELGDWHKHTTYCNPASQINSEIRRQFRPELCTQAWCKFHEILCFDEPIPDWALSSSQVTALHLCEAPGAFVCSLNHFLKSHYRTVRYKWLACSLNPYYEENDPDSCVSDDRLIFRTPEKWCFGPDNTGNIFAPSLLEAVCKRSLALGKVCLVTADGSVNCQNDPARQELDTAHLKFTELLYALRILSPGGSFVLKIFTPLEHTSIQLLYILCSTFNFVAVRKPATSKPGNSELYVTAKDYKGLRTDHELMAKLNQICMSNTHTLPELFSTDNLPADFITKYKACVETFVKYQMDAISRNIDLYASTQHGCYDSYRKNDDFKDTVESVRPQKWDFEKPIAVSSDNTPEDSEVKWLSGAPSCQYEDIILTFGRPISSIRTSLFCDTTKLLALRQYHNSSQSRSVIPTDISTVAQCLKEMLISGSDEQIFEVELVDDGVQCREILGQSCQELLNCKPLHISAQTALREGSVLLASFIRRSYAEGSIHELSIKNYFLKLVLYIMHNSQPQSNFVVILPSSLTRLVAGLLRIIHSTFESVAFVHLQYPCLLVLCKNFTQSGSYDELLKMALQQSVENSNDLCLLGIMPESYLLQDEAFVEALRRSNNGIVNSMLQRKDDILL